MAKFELSYKRISQWIFILGLASLLILLKPIGGVAAACVFIILMSSMVVCYHSLRLFKSLPGYISMKYFLIGTFIILGGAIFDIMATVICSPDLSEEGNPIVLTLFDLHCPLWGIYLFTLLLQVFIVSFTIISWANSLKIYPQIVKIVPYKNLFTTCKWLMGCGQMSLLDFILNRKLNYCLFMSSSTFVLVILHINRWYFALEWFQLVPFSRTIPAVIICIMLFYFLIKIHKKILYLSEIASI